MTPTRNVGLFPLWTAQYGNIEVTLSYKEKAITLVVAAIAFFTLGIIASIFALIGSSYYLKHRKCDQMDNAHSISNSLTPSVAPSANIAPVPSVAPSANIAPVPSVAPSANVAPIQTKIENPLEATVSINKQTIGELQKKGIYITLAYKDDFRFNFDQNHFDCLLAPKGVNIPVHCFIMCTNDRVEGFYNKAEMNDWLRETNGCLRYIIQLQKAEVIMDSSEAQTNHLRTTTAISPSVPIPLFKIKYSQSQKTTLTDGLKVANEICFSTINRYIKHYCEINGLL